MNNITQILGSPLSFLDDIFKNLDSDSIDVSEYLLDHICYRVLTVEKYNNLKNELSKYGTCLKENLISGRMIATFKLDEPITYKGREIFLLELPSPKQGSHYEDGYEHVEFVIDSSFEDFMKKYSNVNFVTKDINKENNPDIKVKYSSCGAVKFHHDSLENVL